MMNAVEIRTARLALRPAGPEYAAAVHRYASDREHTKYMVFLPNETFQETVDFLTRARGEWEKDDPQCFEFVILRAGEVIGGADVERCEDAETAELGWILRPDCAGRGYACEAARGMMDWAEETLGIRSFIAHCDSENERSWRLMERLGMARAGVSGGRRNRGSEEERLEYTYELRR